MRDADTREFYSTPQLLLEAMQTLIRDLPEARLVKNQVGNLAVMRVTDGVWEYVGYVDLHSGEVHLHAEVES